MNFKKLISPHCHIQSLDTASTPEAFAKREIELGTGHIVCTDHGTMQATRHVYDLAKKKGLKPILGCEIYFRDDNDTILQSAGFSRDVDGTYRSTFKYGHATLHCVDQQAYEALIKTLSHADLTRSERHGSERKPLFNWADLEYLGGYNITMTSGCLAGMVQRHLVDHGNPDLARAYYEKLRSLVKPGNFFVEIFPHVCDTYWQSAVLVTWEDGIVEKFQLWKQLKTVDHGYGKAEELAKKLKKINPSDLPVVVARMDNKKWVDLPPRKIKDIQLSEGFVKNECKPWAEDGDYQAGCNQFLLYLAAEYGDPVIVSDDSHFATEDEKVVQDIRLMAGGNKWRFAGSYHRQTSEEAYEYFKNRMGVDPKTFESWIDNNHSFASKFKDFKLVAKQGLATKFYPQDTLSYAMQLIEKHGRMDWNNQVLVDRLQSEIELLYSNGTIDFLPYFFPIEEICDKYSKEGEYCGCGRGSAAGLLLSYLLNITHVDPIKYGLSKERFLTLSRIKSGKYPDIDTDFANRDILVGKDGMSGWLKDRFGDCYAHISTDTTLRLSSSVRDVARVTHGKVPDDVERLAKLFQRTPQGIDDKNFIFGYEDSKGDWVKGSIETDEALKEYVRKYPKEFEIVKKALGLQRSKGQHPCAFIISSTPISDFIPMTLVSDMPVTAFTYKSVEAAGGLKMDFLTVSTLNDIRDCVKSIQIRNGGLITESMVIDGKKVPGHRILPINNRYYDIWDLPENQNVFHDICESKTETVFQFNTPSATKYLSEFNFLKPGSDHKALDSIEALATFTALDRPGPLDYYVEENGKKHNMLVEYARRARGEKPIGNFPVLDEMLPETYGIIVYQEQIQRMFQALGNTTAEEADEFRVHISKKQVELVMKDRAVFMKGAVEKFGEDTANNLWNSMESFASYSFNKSHSVCYVTISYACAFLKHHFPLEWWCSVLRNADKDEINTTFWNFCGHLIDLPDVNLSDDNFTIVNGRIRAPLNLLHGIGEKAHNQLCAGKPYKDIYDFCEKIESFKKSGSTQVLDKKGNPKVKLGHSSLNKTVICRLIVSGAMNSLFPVNTTTNEQIDMFIDATNRACGKKKLKAKDIDPIYKELDGLTKYQIRKQILPAYYEDLLQYLPSENLPMFFCNEQGTFWQYTNNDGKFDFTNFLTLEDIDTINSSSAWEALEGKTISIAIIGYVKQQRKFGFGADGKKACEYIIDIKGGSLKSVKWPGRNSKDLPEKYKQDLTGAIVVALLVKRQKEKPFSIDDLTVIKHPLQKAEESPNES